MDSDRIIEAHALWRNYRTRNGQGHLQGKTPALMSFVDWGHQKLSFNVGSYLVPELPPSPQVTSVRAIVKYAGKIVVMENEDSRT